MALSKDVDLVKKTMNFREGDFEKVAELFPSKHPSVMVRTILSAFVDKHYKEAKPPPTKEEIDL
jgi:hypothetical protein